MTELDLFEGYIFNSDGFFDKSFSCIIFGNFSKSISTSATFSFLSFFKYVYICDCSRRFDILFESILD